MAETVTHTQEAYDRGDAETLASLYAEGGVPEVAPAERGTNEKRPFYNMVTIPVVIIVGIIMAALTPKDVPPKMDPNCQHRINPAYVQWKAEQRAKKQHLSGGGGTSRN